MRPAPLALLIPVLARPHRVEPVLESIAKATPSPYRVLFIASPGDEAELKALEGAEAEVLLHEGGYAAKINAAAAETFEELVFTGADDLDFERGWLDAALSTGADVIGINDLIDRPREHATHFVIRRRYIDRGQIDGAAGIFHEGYRHWYVDDELLATAKLRGAYGYAAESRVRHLHPLAGLAKDDETYRRGRRHAAADRRLFTRRRSLWGGR